MNDLMKTDDITAIVFNSKTSGDAERAVSTYLFELGHTIEKGNAVQMWDHFQRYKVACDALSIRTEKYTPMMPITAWMVMGLTQEEATAILAGKLYQNDPDVKDVLQRVKTYILSDMEQALVQGSIYPSTLIWYQKNFAGMSDFPEPVKIELSELDTMTPQEIAEKYKAILD